MYVSVYIHTYMSTYTYWPQPSTKTIAWSLFFVGLNHQYIYLHGLKYIVSLQENKHSRWLWTMKRYHWNSNLITIYCPIIKESDFFFCENEARLHEAIMNLYMHAWLFSCLSIASVDGKQHLSEVVFSVLVAFSLLEKYPTFGRGRKKRNKTAYLERWKPNHPRSLVSRLFVKMSQSSD